MSSQSALFWFQVLTFLGALLTAAGGFGAFHFSRKVEAEKDRTNSDQQSVLNRQISELLEGNASLKSSLEPFKAFAKDRFPEADVTTALKRLEDELSRIDALTKPTVMKVESSFQHATAEGKHEAIIRLLPIGSTVIPILTIGARANDGTPIEAINVTGPTVPIMSTDYDSPVGRMKEFRTVSPGPITVSVVLPRKPDFLHFDITPLANESITKQ